MNRDTGVWSCVTISATRATLFGLIAVAGCSQSGQPAAFGFTTSGQIEDPRLREASGLARSQRQAGVLWVVNDSGAQERVHALTPSGDSLGEFILGDAVNTDWEDLASFSVDGQPVLMIADIGDNASKRAYGTLYFVTEPAALSHSPAALSWQVDFRFPDGPRDAESAAVDTEAQQVLILSKRDIPPVLYSVPLRAGDEPVIANRLGPVNSLHSPTVDERAAAPIRLDWFWQPVGMDISADNRAAVILTYRAVYYYERELDQSWIDALNRPPLRTELGAIRNAEAIAFGDNARTVFVTGESEHSPILRINLSGEPRQ